MSTLYIICVSGVWCLCVTPLSNAYNIYATRISLNIDVTISSDAALAVRLNL